VKENRPGESLIAVRLCTDLCTLRDLFAKIERTRVAASPFVFSSSGGRI
jgi:hypothetical protein